MIDINISKVCKSFGFDLVLNNIDITVQKGEKVRLKIFCLIQNSYNFLILDEPTSGLDPFSRDELLELFIRLKKEGVAIFFSTHIISDIEKCADNIVYIS